MARSWKVTWTEDGLRSWLPGGLILGLILCWVLWVGPVFETNDDVGMLLLSEGMVSGKPEMGLVFSNPWLGEVIRLLYVQLPSIPWYSLYLYGFLSLAAVLYLWSVPRVAGGAFVRLGLYALFLVFFAEAFAAIQFTRVAILLGAASAMVFLTDSFDGKVDLRRAALWGALFGVSSVVREGGFLASSLLLIPALILLRNRIGLARGAVFLAVALGGLVLNLASTRLYDRVHPSWSQYRAFNEARGGLFGTYRLTYENVHYAESLRRAGWSSNDRNLFKHVVFSDSGVFSAANLRLLVDASARRRGDWINTVWSLRWADYARHWLVLFAILCFAFTVLPVRSAFPLLGYAGGFFGVGQILFLSGRFPHRVGVPLFFLVGVSLFFLMLNKNHRDPHEPLPVLAKWTGMVMILVCLVSASWMGWELSQRNQYFHARIPRHLERVRRSEMAEGGRLTIAQGSSQVYRVVRPFIEGSELAFLKGRFLSLGWGVGSPAYHAVLASFGVKELFEAIASDPRILVSLKDRSLEVFTRYYQEHFGREVGLRRLGDFELGSEDRIERLYEVRFK